MTARSWSQIRTVVERLKYRDWEFLLAPTGPTYALDEDRAHYLQIQARDSATGQWWTARKWLLSQYMTDTEIVSTAWKAVLAAEEHEAREQFLYKGQAVFSPHLSVDQLCDLHAHGTFDVRPDAMQGA